MKGVMLQLPDDLHSWIVATKGDRSIQTFILDVLRSSLEESKREQPRPSPEG